LGHSAAVAAAATLGRAIAAARAAVVAAGPPKSLLPVHFRRVAAWDAQAHLVGTPTGVLDLDGPGATPARPLWRAGDPDDLVTRRLGVGYTPALTRTAPAVVAVADDLVARMWPDPAVAAAAVAAFGACLRGDNAPGAIFVLSGMGSTGKSTILHVMLALFGTYGTRAEQPLLERRFPDLALEALRDTRLAVIDGVRTVSRVVDNDQVDVLPVAAAVLRPFCGGPGATFGCRRLYAPATTTHAVTFTLVMATVADLVVADEAVAPMFEAAVRILPCTVRFGVMPDLAVPLPHRRSRHVHPPDATAVAGHAAAFATVEHLEALLWMLVQTTAIDCLQQM
jgi:hypothetical protein